MQRCTLCPFGVVFPDSLPGLALRTAELQEIARRIPVDTWLQSDYPDELESQELALALFPKDEAKAFVDQFRVQLQSGERIIADVEPSY